MRYLKLVLIVLLASTSLALAHGLRVYADDGYKEASGTCSYGSNTHPNQWCGYFKGTKDDWGGNVLNSGVYVSGSTSLDKAKSFISIIENDLNRCNGSNIHDQTGASFIILTMMGVSGWHGRGTGPNCHDAINLESVPDMKQY